MENSGLGTGRSRRPRQNMAPFASIALSRIGGMRRRRPGLNCTNGFFAGSAAAAVRLKFVLQSAHCFIYDTFGG